MRQLFISIAFMSVSFAARASAVGDSVFVFQVESKVTDLTDMSETRHGYLLYLTPEMIYQKDSIGNETIVYDTLNLFIDHQEELVILNHSGSSRNQLPSGNKFLEAGSFCDTTYQAASYEAEQTLSIVCYRRVNADVKVEMPKVSQILGVNTQGEWTLQGRFRHYQLIIFNH